MEKIQIALAKDNGAEVVYVGWVLDALKDHSDFKVQSIDSVQIKSGGLDDFDLLIVPGGYPYSTVQTYKDEGCKKVADFVSSGRGLIGICNGLYCLAEGFDEDTGWKSNAQMELLAAKLKFNDWERGEGDVRVEKSNGETLVMEYHNGPLIEPKPNPEIKPFQVLATFQESVGAPGSMIGEPAIVAGQYGKGRIIGFSSHPENSHRDVLWKGIQWVVKDGPIPENLGWADVF